MVRTRKGIYIGNQEIKRRYIGNKLIFENLGDMADKDKVSGVVIFTDKADNSVVHVEVDGKSYQDGVPSPDYPIEIHSLNDFDVVSSIGNRNLLTLNGKESLAAYTPYNSLWEIDGTVIRTIIQRAGVNLTLRAADLVTGYFSDWVLLTISGFVRVNGRIPNDNIFPRQSLSTHTSLSETIDFEYRVEEGYFKTTMRTRYAWYVHAFTSLGEGDVLEIDKLKVERSDMATPYSPALEDITEDDNHSSIDKINLSLSEPLRSVGDVKDRLFRDSDGIWKIERNVELIHPEDGTKTIEETYGVLDSPLHEMLSQDYQDKLNNLRSFENSNYVYTVSNNDISPTLHTTFKSKGWYDYYQKTLLK